MNPTNSQPVDTGSHGNCLDPSHITNCTFDCPDPADKQDDKDKATHLKHCYQGEDYADSCKYGDEDCPAKATNSPQASETAETCPAGHAGVDRLTDGMPIPCNEPSCTYYRRPITKATEEVSVDPQPNENSGSNESYSRADSVNKDIQEIILSVKYSEKGGIADQEATAAILALLNKSRIDEARECYSAVIKVIQDRRDDPNLYWQDIANPIADRIKQLKEEARNNG